MPAGIEDLFAAFTPASHPANLTERPPDARRAPAGALQGPRGPAGRPDQGRALPGVGPSPRVATKHLEL